MIARNDARTYAVNLHDRGLGICAHATMKHGEHKIVGAHRAATSGVYDGGTSSLSVGAVAAISP